MVDLVAEVIDRLPFQESIKMVTEQAPVNMTVLKTAVPLGPASCKPGQVPPVVDVLMRWLRRLGWSFTRVTTPDEVSDLRTRLRNDPSIAALLVAHVSPHGYAHDVEVVQYHDGGLWVRGRGPFEDKFSAWQPYPGSFDLVAALPKFQSEVPHLRATASEASRVGRLGELGLATREDAEWVVCRYPLIDELPDGTMRDMLWRIVQNPDSARPSE